MNARLQSVANPAVYAAGQAAATAGPPLTIQSCCVMNLLSASRHAYNDFATRAKVKCSLSRGLDPSSQARLYVNAALA